MPLVHHSVLVGSGIATEHCPPTRALLEDDDPLTMSISSQNDLSSTEPPAELVRPLRTYPDASLVGLPLDIWEILVDILLKESPRVVHRILHPNERDFSEYASKSPNTTFIESMRRRNGVLGAEPSLRQYLLPLFASNENVSHAYSFHCGFEDLVDAMKWACPGRLNSVRESPLNVKHLAIYLDDPWGLERQLDACPGPPCGGTWADVRKPRARKDYRDTLRKLDVTFNNYDKLRQLEFEWCLTSDAAGHDRSEITAKGRPARVKYGYVVGWRDEDDQWHIQFFDTRGVYSWLEHRMVGQEPKWSGIAARIKLDMIPVSHYTGTKF